MERLEPLLKPPASRLLVSVLGTVGVAFDDRTRWHMVQTHTVHGLVYFLPSSSTPTCEGFNNIVLIE